MKRASAQTRWLWAALIGSLALISLLTHFFVAQRHSINPSLQLVALDAFCIVLCCIGGIGLGELRALDKGDAIKTIRVIVIILLAPLLFQWDGQRSPLLLLAGTLVLAFALPLAFWYKRADQK